MNVNWFKNPDNIVYAPLEYFADNFAKETGIPNLKDEIIAFRDNPTAEGKLLKGLKRTSLKLLVPNLTFDEKIEMGENVWLYMGEMSPAYCLYIPCEE